MSERMRHVFLLVSVATATAIGFPNHARADLVEELLEVSGARQQIMTIPKLVRESARQDKRHASLDPLKREKLEVILNESYAPEKFMAEIERSVQAGVTPNELREMIRWYKSPLGRKVSSSETNAFAEDNAAAEAQLAEELTSHPPKAARVNLLKAIDSVAMATELTLETMAGTIQGLANALNPMLPPEKRIKPAQFAKAFERYKVEARPRLQQKTLLGFLYTYRPLSDDELKRYLAHLKSPASRKFRVAMAQALKKSFNRTASKVAASAGRVISSDKGLYR